MGFSGVWGSRHDDQQGQEKGQPAKGHVSAESLDATESSDHAKKFCELQKTSVIPLRQRSSVSTKFCLTLDAIPIPSAKGS